MRGELASLPELGARIPPTEIVQRYRPAPAVVETLHVNWAKLQGLALARPDPLARLERLEARLVELDMGAVRCEVDALGAHASWAFCITKGPASCLTQVATWCPISGTRSIRALIIQRCTRSVMLSVE